MKSFPFPSKSSTATYTAILADDGKLLCNCKGWTQRRGVSARNCTHTKQIAADLKLTVVARGEFVFVDASTVTDQIVASNVPIAVGGPGENTADDERPRVDRPPPPMLASAMTDPVTGPTFDARFKSGWALEEKINGHRCTAVVRGGHVQAWSRPRRGSTANVRPLGAHIVEQFARFPDGIYDGELVAPGGAASDVVVTGARLVFVVFDVLELRRHATAAMPYHQRRAVLLDVLRTMPANQTAVSTVESLPPTWARVQAIWKRGGEGVVLKRLDSLYRPGDRSPDWLKVKASQAATLTIVGYKAGKSGPYSALMLSDTAGVTTSVKTLGNKLLADVTAAPTSFIGRRVVVHFPGFTATGSYGGPVIFDHFAGAGE